MYKKLFTLIIFALSSTFAQATDFITFKRNAASDVELTNTNDTVTYDPLDWKGVQIAVGNLRQDLKAVTGRENAPVVVGTVGKSKLAKKYKKQSKELEGKWEQYLIFTDNGKLVILGSDKRGKLYYNVYASDAPGVQTEQMAYSYASSIEGPWIYGGFISTSANRGFTIHPSVIEFKKKWYYIYHDGSYNLNGEPGGDCRRSVCAEYLHFDKEGRIKFIPLTQEGISE